MALKPTILLGLLCAAFAANFSPSLLRGYRAGHQYAYNFDGQIASSLSNGEDYSTIRVRSDVTLDFLDNNNVIVKLERPEMASLNGFLSEPERLHSFQKFENLGIKSDHVNKLALPFEMRYENGKIGQIKFHQEDSTWSENIKRSIINLLQVQLEDISEEADEYPASIFYKTNETTIEGECETAYHIQKIEDRNYDSVEETKPSVNITKTVNYESCKRRPELRYNYYRASEPVEWNSQQGFQPNNDIDPVVDAMSHYDISLENSIIKNAKVLSKYSYDLVTKEQVSLATITVGQIKYRSTEKRSPPESDFSKKSPQDLMHSTEYDVLKEKFIAEGNEEYLRKNPYLRLDNAGDVVKNIMRRLVKSSVEKTGPEGMDEDATRQFTNLVTILRLCSKDDISKIHRDTFLSSEFNDQTKQFVQEILADALAVAGTKNTIDHLVEKIQAQEITPSKAARTLEKLYKLRLTSVEMTKPVWKLCQSNVAQNNENLKRSCYLAWGAMVNAMCGHDHEHEHDHEKWAISMEKKICSQSVKKQFIQDAMSLYKGASNKADKILALKTIGNMGIDESVSSLETVISDKAQDRLVRLNAIDALRNLRDQVPQKVQRLLTPVFRDRREHPEIRMNAFQQLLQTRPDAALLHMLCADMAHETNVDVKSFVVTSIQRLAENADKILDKESQQAIKSCLILLEQMDESITRQSASKKHQYGYFSEPTNWHEFGSLVNFVSLFSNDSYLPREVMASWDLLMGGRMIPNHMQLGLHMQELEQFTSKLYKNIESKNFDELLTRGKRSLMTQYNPLAMLKNLFQKMELVARRRASDAEPSFMLYRRLNNLDYSFFLIDETSLPEILKKLMLEGRVDVNDLEEDNQIIRTNGAMYNFESQMKLPTTMGVPMIISSRMSTIGFVDGKYTLGFNKAEKIRDVNVEIQLYPRLATSVIVKMEMFSPLFTSGVKTIHSMQGRLPLDMTVEIKSPNVVPTITWRLPQQETRLLHLQCRPITFIRSWPERSNVFVDAKEKTLLIPQLERLHSTNDLEFEAPLTGMRFVVEGHGYRKPWSNLDWILSGENAFVLKISPTASSAKAVRLGGEYSSTRDSVQTRQKLEKIFDEHPELFQQQEEQETKILQDYIRRSTSKLVEFQRLVLKAEAVDNRENFVSMDFKVACADQATACLFEKNVKADLGRTWTWKTIGQFAKPELHGIYGSVKSRHVVGKVETNWGSQEKNTVVMNFYGKPSQQRIHQFKSLLNKHIDMSDNYERENMLDEKFDQIPSVLKANEYVMSLEHQVSEKAMQTIVPLYNWMKACPKANIYIPDQSKVDSLMSQRHSTIMARVSYDNALNLTLTTPEEQVEMLHWDSEPQMSRNPKTIVDVFASSHDDYAKCTYKRQQIETFDGQTIDIPLTTCYTLLAKDCGDETNPNFAVLARKTSKRSEDLKVKFITRKRIYELYKNERDGQMVITVDGNILREDQFEQYNVRKIESNTLTIYEVKCQHAEAIVRFDGQKLSIKISDSYLNRQCGVCGHMNRDREDDFLKHDNTQAKNAQDFHLSYLDRDASECDPSIINELQAEANKDSRRRQPAQSNYDDDRETRNPTKKTMIMEKRQEVCFSLKSVKVCPKGYEASETDQDEQVDFVCYKRSSTTAQQKLREARDEQVITFENETPDYTEMVTIPRRCVQY